MVNVATVRPTQVIDEEKNLVEKTTPTMYSKELL